MMILQTINNSMSADTLGRLNARIEALIEERGKKNDRKTRFLGVFQGIFSVVFESPYVINTPTSAFCTL